MVPTTAVFSSPRGLLRLEIDDPVPRIVILGMFDIDLVSQVTPLHFTEWRYRDLVAVDMRGVTSVDTSAFDFFVHLEQGAQMVRVIGAARHIQRELLPSELDHTYFFDAA